VVWLTGMPSSGKSTLGARLKDRLRTEGWPCCLLDGDAVREVLVPRPGYSPEAREAFYASLAGLAGLLARDGAVVVVAATAHRRAFRERARALAPSFVEVFVDVDPAECARRDAKGLYAATRAGEVGGLPGADLEYEPPAAPDLVARGGLDDAAVASIIQRIAAVLKEPKEVA
jgi:adenylylsulfate kinase